MKSDLLILVNENLLNAEHAFRDANVENIVKRCRDYLSMLSDYREKLYKLRGTPEICLNQSSMMARELVEQTRKAIRTSLEFTIKESNEVESLLKSFTKISGYEAVSTFNLLKYQGYDNWEQRAGGIRLIDDISNSRLPIQEAVEIASRLRREAYINQRISS